MYLIYVLFIFINIFLTKKFKIVRQKKDESDYSFVERCDRYSKIIDKNNLYNITIILFNTIYFVYMFFFENINNLYNMIDFALFLTSLCSYFYFAFSSKDRKIKKMIYVNKSNSKYNYVFNIVYFSFLTVVLCDRVGRVGNADIIGYGYLLAILLVAISILVFITFIIKNREFCTMAKEEETYIDSIKFSTKFILSTLFNYVAFMLIYILLINCNFKYMFIINILVLVILIYVLVKKVKKTYFEMKRVDNAVYITHEGLNEFYAFDFARDIERTSNLLFFIVIYFISFSSYYVYDAFSFNCLTVILYIAFFIKLFISQKDLAYFMLATDDNFINKKDYNIILEKNNFEIKKIYVGNNKYLYKIVYVDNDNISYESVILLYDPELFIDNIKIYKSSKDNNKYIIYVRELYV